MMKNNKNKTLEKGIQTPWQRVEDLI